VTSIEARPLFLSDSFIAVARVPEVASLVEGRHSVGAGAEPVFTLDLERSRVGIQTSFCSEFEANQLEIGAGGLVFLVRYIEHAKLSGSSAPVPVEVARVVYRADTVELAAELL
jgi:DNA-binding GntR family transcriptional regulator